jgi:hypothetical protein
LTISTKWVGPTSPVESGGEQHPALTPWKFVLLNTLVSGPAVDEAPAAGSFGAFFGAGLVRAAAAFFAALRASAS